MKTRLPTIISGVIAYLCLLALTTALYYAPVKYQDTGAVENISFVKESGQISVKENGNGFVFYPCPDNETSSPQVVGTPVSLTVGSAYRVSFTAENEGRDNESIHVDLYTPSFDLNENEVELQVAPGSEHFETIIPFGREHPAACDLRFYAFNHSKIDFSDISIMCLARDKTQSVPVIICGLLFAVSLVVFLTMLVAAWIRRTREKNDPDD